MSDSQLLAIIGEFQTQKHRADLDAVRALFSTMLGEKLDQYTFKSLLSKVIERGYVNIQNETELSLTPAGQNIASTLIAKMLKEEDKKLISNIVKNYITSPDSKKREILKELERSVEERKLFTGRRFQKVDGQNLISNCITGEFRFTEKTFYDNRYAFNLLRSMTDQAARYRIVARVKYSAQDEYKNWAVSSVAPDGDISLISPVQMGAIKIDQTTTLTPKSPTDSIAVHAEPSRSAWLARRIFEEFLTRTFMRHGFTKVGIGLNYVNYNQTSKENSNIGVLRYSDGFRCKVELVPTDAGAMRLFLWIDSVSRLTYTLFDFIAFLRSSGAKDDEIRKRVSALKVHVLPYGSVGHVDSLGTSDCDVLSELVENAGKSYSQFWEQRHGIKLKERFQPLVKVKLSNQVFEYPSEMVYLDRLDAERLLGSAKDLKPRYPGPAERIEKITKLFETVLGSKIFSAGFEVELKPQLLSWETLKVLGYCDGIWTISPPQLLFNRSAQGDETTSDQRTLFKFGPYSGPKEIIVSSLIVPQNVQEYEIDQFKEALSAAYRKHKFGNLNFRNTFVARLSYDRLREDPERLTTIVKSMPMVDNARRDHIVIAILPFANSRLYYKIKKLVLAERNMPVQVLRERTVRRIVDGEYGVTKNMILQIYTKLIDKNEAVWILRDPCDNDSRTMFVGIGFSQTPLEGKKANSFAAVCDSQGRELDWKPIGVPFEDKYIRKVWFEAFLEYLQEQKANHSRIKRFCIMRRGTTYEDELKVMTEVLQHSGISEFDFISAKYDIRKIFVRSQGWENPADSIFISIGKKQGLVSMNPFGSKTRQGTSQLASIEIELGTSEIMDVVGEYHDLTYLNWTSALAASKSPLVLNLAGKIADMMKEVRDERIFEFFPS